MAKEVQKIEGERIDNPFGGLATKAASGGPSNSVTQTESQRAMIEVMTSFEVAKRFPRDPSKAMANILAECGRPSLAEVAVYQFSRGGTDINGPSIRLMEAIARAWGNTQFGFRVLERRGNSSSIQAFARDLETNTFIERTFDLRHWRDTKGGGYPIKEERDIYELEANMAQRRVRSCIIGQIPGDVIDAAVAQCELTMKQNADVSAEGLKKLVATFETVGVNKAMIEGRIQCKLNAIKPVQFATLRKIYVSLRDGMGKPEEFFDVSLADKKVEKEEKQPDLKKDVKDKKEKTAKQDPKPVDRIGNELVAAKDLKALNAAWCDGGDIEGPNAADLKAMDVPSWNKLRDLHDERVAEFEGQQ